MIQERWERHKNFERIRFDMQVATPAMDWLEKFPLGKTEKHWNRWFFLVTSCWLQDMLVNKKFIGTC